MLNGKGQVSKEAQLAAAVVICGCATSLVLKTAPTSPQLGGLAQQPCYL